MKSRLAQRKQAVTLTVTSQRPALVWFNGAGALRAVETQGECRLGGDRVVVDETRGILLTLDGQDVRRSRALLLMPLQPGQVRWVSGQAWADPIIEAGEVRDGGWQALETQPARGSETEMRVQVSPDQAFRLLLVCEKTALPHWRQALARAMTDPGSLP